MSWNQDRKEVTDAGHIAHDGSSSSLVRFLVQIIGRTDRTSNVPTSEQAAVAELCHPVVVGVFKYMNTLRGLAASLAASSCQVRHNASGATFIDNLPDDIWKYVPIHELGHCFGLCHVDGIDRIMVSSKENSLWSWSILWNWCVRGEPYFTLDEAKATWDYIVANFAPDCLGARPVIIT